MLEEGCLLAEVGVYILRAELLKEQYLSDGFQPFGEVGIPVYTYLNFVSRVINEGKDAHMVYWCVGHIVFVFVVRLFVVRYVSFCNH